MSPTRRETDPRRRLILALDLPTGDAALRLADQLRGDLTWVKVGLQLFGAEGPDIVRKLVSMGLNVFVDLKLHDIPNTMARAGESLAGLGAGMFTTHAAAGQEALRQTSDAVAASPEGPGGRKPMVLAVTVLTSFSAEGYSEVVGRDCEPAREVPRLGELAVGAGVDGLVASPMEVRTLRERIGDDPILVIPGIRPAGSATDDQQRIATPASALADGADYLVVGRPIAKADHPREALLRILDEMDAAARQR
jgi:orotidine-5'-phosphate decarboxylase